VNVTVVVTAQDFPLEITGVMFSEDFYPEITSVSHTCALAEMCRRHSETQTYISRALNDEPFCGRNWR
jgi:hypothetical protein